MSINESGEMYLETIYILCKSKPSVRSVDIAEYMNYTKPSISRGVGLLKKRGLITVDKDGFINLTREGAALAGKIYERHTVLTDVLRALGVDEATAADDACKIEHVISEESFDAIKRHTERK
ncbi:MAG: metal-dependent transcriptional regulator [Clostridia bacterium]|nr:metal-dependent transcriptional regulator [Clostridia bacterium]